MNKKVCILGTASTMYRAPFDDKTFDFWACSPVPTHPEMREKHYDLLFELHDDNYYMQPAVLERLNESQCPIMMKKKVSSIKKSVELPFAELVEYFEGRKYFTSTIAFMIAMAIRKGYQEIHLYGVHMSASEEYGSQRQACEYWLGVAEGRGCKIFVPQESEILHTPYIYGYELENDVVAQARIRRLGLLEGVKIYEDKKVDALIRLNQNIGALKTLMTFDGHDDEKEELEKAIIKDKAEIKEIEMQINKNLGAVSEDEHWIRRYSYSGKLESKG